MCGCRAGAQRPQGWVWMHARERPYRWRCCPTCRRRWCVDACAGTAIPSSRRHSYDAVGVGSLICPGAAFHSGHSGLPTPGFRVRWRWNAEMISRQLRMRPYRPPTPRILLSLTLGPRNVHMSNDPAVISVTCSQFRAFLVLGNWYVRSSSASPAISAPNSRNPVFAGVGAPYVRHPCALAAISVICNQHPPKLGDRRLMCPLASHFSGQTGSSPPAPAETRRWTSRMPTLRRCVRSYRMTADRFSRQATLGAPYVRARVGFPGISAPGRQNLASVDVGHPICPLLARFSGHIGHLQSAFAETRRQAPDMSAPASGSQPYRPPAARRVPAARGPWLPLRARLCAGRRPPRWPSRRRRP